MPRPARHDQLPRLTGLIDWEALGSLIDGNDTELPSTVEDRSLPILGTDSLPLPRGILDANSRSLSQDVDQVQNWVGPLSSPPDAALGFFPLQYLETPSETVFPRDPSSDFDQSMTSRLQQGRNALRSLGFPSVDAFAFEYYTARLGSSPRISVEEDCGDRGTFDRLVTLLQNASPQVEAIDVNGLHQDMARSARDLYIAELRDFDHASYNTDKAEQQVSGIFQ